jgi:hypothetical protein
MAVSLDGKLVVAISSRALFDFEEENQIFEQGDDRAYMQLQLERLEQPAKPGVAFSLVRKLLAFNDADAQRVEVVILSRNDPVSGMRVFRSAQHYGLPIERGSFTRGPAAVALPQAAERQPVPVTHLSDVRAALTPACRRRRCTRTRCWHPTRTPTKCASHSTATPCCSRTKRSACSSARAELHSSSTSGKPRSVPAR